MKDITEVIPEIMWVVILAALAVSIAIVVAILKIPRIARYQKASLKLTAMMAKQAGVDSEAIQGVINEADIYRTPEERTILEDQLTSEA